MKIKVMLTDANYKSYKAISLNGTFVRAAKQGDVFEITPEQFEDAKAKRIGLSKVESDEDQAAKLAKIEADRQAKAKLAEAQRLANQRRAAKAKADRKAKTLADQKAKANNTVNQPKGK